MKNFPALHSGFSSDHLPTFQAIFIPPGYIPIKSKAATTDGDGSGKGMQVSSTARISVGISTFRKTNVAILLANKYSAQMFAAQ